MFCTIYLATNLVEFSQTHSQSSTSYHNDHRCLLCLALCGIRSEIKSNQNVLTQYPDSLYSDSHFCNLSGYRNTIMYQWTNQHGRGEWQFSFSEMAGFIWKLNIDNEKSEILTMKTILLRRYVTTLCVHISGKGIREITQQLIKSFAYKIALEEHFWSYHICNYLYWYFSFTVLPLSVNFHIHICLPNSVHDSSWTFFMKNYFCYE